MMGVSFSKSALHLRPTEKVELFTSFCIAHETRLDIDLCNISFCMGLASQLSNISIDKNKSNVRLAMSAYKPTNIYQNKLL